MGTSVWDAPEMNIPFGNFPSRSFSPFARSVAGSSSTGRPASYSAYTFPPHASTFVFARFFWCKSNALRSGPPSRIVPNVPRYVTAFAASSASNSSVRTNREMKAHEPSSRNSNRHTYPSPSSMCAYAFPPRSKSPGPLR